MPNDAPSLRETLESAISESQEPVEAPETVVEEAAPAPAEAAPEAEAPAQTAAERARDEAGRFAKASEKKPEVKPAAAPEGAKKAGQMQPAAAGQAKAGGVTPAPPPVAPPAPAVTEAPKVKAPQSFRAPVRELAARLPAEYHPILEEAVRIDNEAKRALNDSAQARQFAQGVQQSLAPYQGIAQANGTDVMTFAGRALQAYGALYVGTPDVAADSLIRGFDVLKQRVGEERALEMLNARIQNPQAARPQHVPQPQVTPEAMLDQLLPKLEQRVEAARATRDAEAFIASAPEFLPDVQADMIEILRLAESRGAKMTCQQAYDRACKLNEGVQSTIAQRKASEAARANAPTVQRAKVAASSVRASPVEAVTRSKGPRTLREDIEAAVVEAQRT
jgi:hypothetical protein